MNQIKSYLDGKTSLLSRHDAHSGSVEAVFDLLWVVNLQQIVTTKFHIVHRLTVLKEVHRE